MTTRTVAAFDFDGTMTTSDSCRVFVQQTVGSFRYALAVARCAPWLAAMFAKICDPGLAKERFLKFALGKLTEDALDAAADAFVERHLPKIIRIECLRRMVEHRVLGHDVVLVSASPAIYLKRWAKTVGIETVLATELEVIDGKFTGRLATKNCRGLEKVNRLAAWWGDQPPTTLYVYGDSAGDREMAALGDFSWIRGRGPMPALSESR